MDSAFDIMTEVYNTSRVPINKTNPRLGRTSPKKSEHRRFVIVDRGLARVHSAKSIYKLKTGAEMKSAISKEALQQIFTEARTHHHWTKQPLNDDILKDVYELAKWGPTSVNANPMRILFIKSAAQKELLMPALSGSNVEQCKAAPVVAVIAHDTKFYDHLPKLFPAFDARSMFASNAAASESTAFRNGSLQGAYFMIAARALGLDVGPMSGFDNAKLDEAFFKDSSWRSNFICAMGYGDLEKVYPRGARLTFAEACKIV